MRSNGGIRSAGGHALMPSTPGHCPCASTHFQHAQVSACRALAAMCCNAPATVLQRLVPHVLQGELASPCCLRVPHSHQGGQDGPKGGADLSLHVANETEWTTCLLTISFMILASNCQVPHLSPAFETVATLRVYAHARCCASPCERGLPAEGYQPCAERRRPVLRRHGRDDRRVPAAVEGGCAAPGH